jgi:predicted nucleic acid-binding protein
VKYKAVELVYSSISIQEITDSPFSENSHSILGFIEENAKYYISKKNNKIAISLTEEIMNTGIKLKDASHVACAIIAKCNYFITTGKRLAKYQDNRMKIINPIEFIKIWRTL